MARRTSALTAAMGGYQPLDIAGGSYGLENLVAPWFKKEEPEDFNTQLNANQKVLSDAYLLGDKQRTSDVQHDIADRFGDDPDLTDDDVLREVEKAYLKHGEFETPLKIQSSLLGQKREERQQAAAEDRLRREERNAERADKRLEIAERRADKPEKTPKPTIMVNPETGEEELVDLTDKETFRALSKRGFRGRAIKSEEDIFGDKKDGEDSQGPGTWDKISDFIMNRSSKLPPTTARVLVRKQGPPHG